MFQKPVIRCDQCGNVVSRKKFLNRTFYLSEGSTLVALVSEKKARAVACLNCLQILESQESGRIEKAEFDNRTIYTLRPILLERFQMIIERFFNGRK